MQPSDFLRLPPPNSPTINQPQPHSGAGILSNTYDQEPAPTESGASELNSEPNSQPSSSSAALPVLAPSSSSDYLASRSVSDISITPQHRQPSNGQPSNGQPSNGQPIARQTSQLSSSCTAVTAPTEGTFKTPSSPTSSPANLDVTDDLELQKPVERDDRTLSSSVPVPPLPHQDYLPLMSLSVQKDQAGDSIEGDGMASQADLSLDISNYNAEELRPAPIGSSKHLPSRQSNIPPLSTDDNNLVYVDPEKCRSKIINNSDRTSVGSRTNANTDAFGTPLAPLDENCSRQSGDHFPSSSSMGTLNSNIPSVNEEQAVPPLTLHPQPTQSQRGDEGASSTPPPLTVNPPCSVPHTLHSSQSFPGAAHHPHMYPNQAFLPPNNQQHRLYAPPYLPPPPAQQYYNAHSAPPYPPSYHYPDQYQYQPYQQPPMYQPPYPPHPSQQHPNQQQPNQPPNRGQQHPGSRQQIHSSVSHCVLLPVSVVRWLLELSFQFAMVNFHGAKMRKGNSYQQTENIKEDSTLFLG